MEKLDFERQVARLSSTFTNKYPSERVISLWTQVKDFDSAWLQKIVSNAVMAFTDVKWHEEISKKREYQAQESKARFKNDSFEKASVFSSKDVSQHFKVLKALIEKKLTPEEGKLYAECLRSALAESETKFCRHCSNEGLVCAEDNQGYVWAYKCFCRIGQARQERYPTYEVISRSRKWG